MLLRTTKVFFLLVGLSFVTTPLVSLVDAKPLTPEECGVLRQQKTELENKGVGKTLQKGAEWGAANLDAAQIGEVGAFLKLTEEISFRCNTSVGKKKKTTGLLARIPLPVRNPRRVKQEQAALKAAAPSLASDGEMVSGVKAVLSAAPKEGVSDQKEPAPQNKAAPVMRKTLGE